jgi:hypothetical protein
MKITVNSANESDLLVAVQFETLAIEKFTTLLDCQTNYVGVKVLNIEIKYTLVMII